MRPGGGKAKGAQFERVFWARVGTCQSDACWLWLNAHDSNGYGVVSIDGKLDRAHRVAWELNRGLKAGRWRIRHRCDNPTCCNPAHLFRGTQSLNMREAFARKRVRDTTGVPKPWVAGTKNGQAKLTSAGVRWARHQFHSGKRSLKQLCKKLGVVPGTLSPAISGKTWRHVQ